LLQDSQKNQGYRLLQDLLWHLRFPTPQRNQYYLFLQKRRPLLPMVRTNPLRQANQLLQQSQGNQSLQDSPSLQDFL
jgi:hypothetical protein